MTKRTPSSEMRAVICGESPMLAEFSKVLHDAGFPIECPAIAGTTPDEIPANCTPTKSISVSAMFAVELSLIGMAEKRLRLRELDAVLPPDTPILTNSITVSVAEQASWIIHPGRLLGIAALPSLISAKLIEAAPGISTDRGIVTRAHDIFIAMGKEVSIVQDRVGLVMPRIVCSLINEAFFAMMEGAASPRDIDLAMKLGTNYPRGPVEWGNAIDLRIVVAILEAIRKDTGEERYRIAPLLRQMSQGQKWWNG